MLAVASLLVFANADSRNMFAPQPVYTPAMNYGQMQVGTPYGVPVDYVQPVEYSAEESDSSALVYATAAVFAGAAIFVANRGQKQSVAEPDLEAAMGAVNVAMLFSSGSRGGGRGKKAQKKKPAKKKAARNQAPADDDDLFVHEGTRGFTGDDFAFVYRQGLAG